MIILGLDPGIERVGWGVVNATKRNLRAIAWGRITTPKQTPLAKRLAMIAKETQKLIRKWKPSRIGIEQIFFAKNLKTAVGVSHARGVLLLIAEESGVPIAEFTPLQIKQTITGYGNADKRQVQMMVKTLLGVQLLSRDDDAADALAIAYTTFVTVPKISNLKSQI